MTPSIMPSWQQMSALTSVKWGLEVRKSDFYLPKLRVRQPL